MLCQANALVGKAQNLKALPTGDVERLRTRYDTILSTAEAGNPPRPRRIFNSLVLTSKGNPQCPNWT